MVCNCSMTIEFKEELDNNQQEIFNSELKKWMIENKEDCYLPACKENYDHPEPLFLFAINLFHNFKDIFNKIKKLRITAFDQEEDVLAEIKR